MRAPFLDPIYPLTHYPNRTGAGHTELARCFLAAGSRFFQIRAKDFTDRLLHEEIQQIAALCLESGARLIVNDRVDLALAASASGVHLGQDDLPVKAARRLLGSTAIIGLSTHTEEQFLEARAQDVDYVALGPIFDSPTKPGANRAVGCVTLARLAATTSLPVVAIGGITLENVIQVWESGAVSAAVISDIVDSPDPSKRIRQYFELAGRRFS